MAPGTNLGAATPVQIGGGGNPLSPPRDGDEKDETTAPKAEDASQAKARNDAIAYIRSLAELRGRNADWAEAAVQTAASLSANAAREQNVIYLVARDQLGRASCRERVCQYVQFSVVALSLNQKHLITILS